MGQQIHRGEKLVITAPGYQLRMHVFTNQPTRLIRLDEFWLISAVNLPGKLHPQSLLHRPRDEGMPPLDLKLLVVRISSRLRNGYNARFFAIDKGRLPAAIPTAAHFLFVSV